MPDALYNSYSLEKSRSESGVITSGVMTTWENSPVSSLDVGDKFRPIPNGPLLTVKKVNINDNVIGTKDGKPFRQWQISVEGDNGKDISVDTETHILYNFNFNAEGHTGTMEVSNTGASPSVNIEIGQSFNVPGIGLIPCINIRGSDAYDENGDHVWTVVYEGSDVPDAQSDEALPENKHSFSIEQDDYGNTIKTGAVSIANEGETPSLSYQVGSSLNIPGLGNVTCSKISASDDHSNGVHVWTVTYEGSNKSAGEQGETLPKVKYSFAIDKDGTSSIKSGTMQVVNAGNAPTFSLSIGGTFPFPGLGNLTCVNISGNDEYTDNDTRIWTVTYEGIIENTHNTKYSLSINKDGSSSVSSGSMQVINEGNSPVLSINVGNNFNVPGLGNITCTSISASDEVSDGGVRRWTVTYEGANKALQQVKYSFSVDKSGSSSTKSGSMQVVNIGDAPTLSLQTGETLSIPGIGDLICTNISASDEISDSGQHVWTVTYEGTIEHSQQTKYSLTIDKDGSSSVSSGSMQVINQGDSPNFSLNVGEAFNIPGLGNVTCTSISASDEVSDSGTRQWNVVYESSALRSQQPKYSLSIDKDGSSSISSGSMQVVNIGDAPNLSLNVGDTFNIPGLGNVVCTNISASDEYSDSGIRRWNVTYESSAVQSQQPKYSFSININGEAVSRSASMQVINEGDSPSLLYNVGDYFRIPGLGNVICTNISASDEYSDGGVRLWTVTYESSTTSTSGGGEGGGESTYSSGSSQNNSVSYEFNGSVVRSVDGTLIALRRSTSPVLRKTITVYNDSNEQIATLGDTYQGGIAVSETIIKEDTTVNGVVTSSHYKHDIEVEA